MSLTIRQRKICNGIADASKLAASGVTEFIAVSSAPNSGANNVRTKRGAYQMPSERMSTGRRATNLDILQPCHSKAQPRYSIEAEASYIKHGIMSTNQCGSEVDDVVAARGCVHCRHNTLLQLFQGQTGRRPSSLVQAMTSSALRHILKALQSQICMDITGQGRV